MSTLTRRLTGVAAILAMLLFLAGVPMLLVAASRAFLPAELPAAEALLGALLRPDDGTFLVGLLVVAGWVVWAAMVVLVLIEVVAALRGVTAPTLRGLRAPQHAIRRLVLTAALAFLVVPAGGQAALAVPGPAPEGVTTHSVTAGDGPGSVLDADGETGGAGAAAGSAEARPGGGARSAAPAGDVRPATHTRPAAVVAVSPTAPGADAAPAEADRLHVVRPGESLWSIAERALGDGRRFTEIAELNRDVLGPTPGFLRTGWELRLPGSSEVASTADGAPVDSTGGPATAAQDAVTVVRGDTLWDLADEHLGEPERYPEIVALNDIEDPDLIHPGETFDLPAGAAASAAGSAPAGVRDDLGTGAAAAEAPAAEGGPKADPTESAVGKAADLKARAAEIVVDPESVSPMSFGRGAAATGAVPAAPDRTDPVRIDPGRTDPGRTDPGRTALAHTAPNRTAAEPAATDESHEDSAFPTRTLFGLGGLAAAGVVAGLAGRRSLQQRRRRSGERTPVASAPAVATERQLRAVADADGVVVIDRSLRHLARACAAAGTPLPDLHALRLTEGHLVVRLAGGATMPAPWTGVPGGTDWSIGREAALALDPEAVDGVPAPYPALVTLGQDDDGHLLIDLEQAGSLGFLGEQRAVRSALAALTLELATSAWADDLQVTVAGTLSLLAETLDNGRLRYVPTVAAVLEELERRAADDRAQLAAQGAPGVRRARASRAAEDTWTPEIVVVAAPTTAAQRRRMAELVCARPRVALAFVTTGEPLGQWQVTISGSLAEIAPLGLPVRPQLLPVDHLDDAQELFAVTGADESMTVVDPGAAARPEVTLAEIRSHTPTAGTAGTAAPSDRVPQSPGATGTGRTDLSTADAIGADDHATTEGTRMEAIAENPTTGAADGDVLVAPHLRLLGPIRLEGARGPVEPKKRGSLTELCAYLALNPGASSEALDESVWPARTGDGTSTRTTATSKLRRWLAKTPEGQDFFPAKGSEGYRLDPRITTDIHRWDELVAGRPEVASTTDLHDALLLVRGRPFLGRGRGRYAWADPLEQRLIDEISEAAHELARRRIAEGRWRSADAALAVGILVDPTSERLLRLRIRIAQASHDPERVAEARARLETIAQVLDCDLEPETEDLLAEIDGKRRLAR